MLRRESGFIVFKIALAWPASEGELARLRTYVTGECEILSPKSYEIKDLVEVALDADAIVGGYVPEEMIVNAEKVKLVQVLHSGVTHRSLDGLDQGFSFNTLRSRNIMLGNIAGANAVAVAEHAFALMLALAKRIVPDHQALAQGSWYPFSRDTMGCELAGKTLGILGVGAIGVELAKRARAFCMGVIGTKRTPAPQLIDELGLDFLGSPEDLPRVLRESDFVAVCVPWMPSTDKMLGEKELRSMKKTAYLINIARAEIIDEEALHRALTEDWIAGYGTDVWWNYDLMPTPSDAVGFIKWGICAPIVSRTGIHKLDNVVMTGDRAAFNAETLENFLRVGMRNVDMLAKGQTPEHIVDLSMQAR